ncbi:MAG: helix-turn-helix domain-containing protein [Chloroflexota bacterium]
MPSARDSSGHSWLTLDQACRRLGVHPSTLRRWVDQGSIGALRTPGGHRRFSAADIEHFEHEHRRAALVAPTDPQLVDRAIARTRQDIAQQRWLVGFSDEDRALHRQLGRRLIGLLLQYAARQDEAPELLAEARALGEQHAYYGQAHGRPLPELLQAIGYFRQAMLEVAIVQVHGRGVAQGEASVHLLRRVEGLLGEMQSGLVDRWVAPGRPSIDYPSGN